MPTPAETQCPKCGHLGLDVTERFIAKPLGTFSLAGVQPKVSARKELHWSCLADDCDAEGPATF